MARYSYKPAVKYVVPENEERIEVLFKLFSEMHILAVKRFINNNELTDYEKDIIIKNIFYGVEENRRHGK